MGNAARKVAHHIDSTGSTYIVEHIRDDIIVELESVLYQIEDILVDSNSSKISVREFFRDAMTELQEKIAYSQELMANTSTSFDHEDDYKILSMIDGLIIIYRLIILVYISPSINKCQNLLHVLNYIISKIYRISEVESMEDLSGLLSAAFSNLGYDEGVTRSGGLTVSRAQITELPKPTEAELIEEWKQIPKYKDEKKRRIAEAQAAAQARGEKVGKRGHWDPKQHFDHWWRGYLEQGTLYRDVLEALDPDLLVALRAALHRQGSNKDSYIIPLRNRANHLQLDV